MFCIQRSTRNSANRSEEREEKDGFHFFTHQDTSHDKGSIKARWSRWGFGGRVDLINSHDSTHKYKIVADRFEPF